ncbi:hypothetical protein P8918_12925 [Bacillus spizizenii]|nr:hypothetical protein [Bacillus spizizenii]MCY8890473.1 hypothetical protein [Bacillus spizizenii]MEC0841928.1 hypothetical protein [Bacillus spizizenii]
MNLGKIEKQWEIYNDEFANSKYMGVDKHSAMAMQVGGLIAEIKKCKKALEEITRQYDNTVVNYAKEVASKALGELTPEERRKIQAY